MIRLFSAALLVSLALLATSGQAKDNGQQQQQQQQQQAPSLASKLIGSPLHQSSPKIRSTRSLSDMFERVKSKIFGSRKQSATQTAASASSTSSQVQPSNSAVQKPAQQWTDLNSFNQQYNPYLTAGNQFQWPISAASSPSTSNLATGNQFASFGQQYSPLAGFSSIQQQQQPAAASSGALMGSGMDQALGGIQSSASSAGSPLSSASPSPSSSSSPIASQGLFSSASHLIAQYLSPGSASSVSATSSLPSGGQAAASMPSPAQLQPQSSSNAIAQIGLTPQQQQQQAQYQEFASILDSMVTQTGGASAQRPQQQAQNLGQYFNSQTGSQVQPQTAPSGSMDNDMSGSSNIQSFMQPAGGVTSQAQAGQQKSTMVGLAEQLAPGSQFNKLVSFPFSLTNNDDPNKEGRFKLHIPFLNQHVKRSDGSSTANGLAAQQRAQQQQIQQYLNSYYNQQQLYAAQSQTGGSQQQQISPSSSPSQQQQQAQQLVGQPSQAVPSIVSPSSDSSPISSSSSSAVSSVQSSPISRATSSSSSISSSSNSAPSPVTSVQSSNSPVASSAAAAAVPAPGSGQQQLSRPSWSVVDLQSSSQSASSSKLIPMQAASPSASSESNNQN